MGSSSLPGFWMSIISDSSLQDQSMSVMGVQDVEERALALLSQTLFLLIMEIKLEHDETQKTTETIMEVIDGCDSCRKNVMADELTNKTITNSIALNTEPQPVKEGHEETNTISGEICEAYQHSGGDRENCEASRSNTAHSGEAAGGKKEAEMHSSTAKKFKSSVLPCQDVDKGDASLAVTQSGHEIMVPGTMDVMSQSLGSPLEMTFITQKVFVPEAVCMDDYKLHDTSGVFEDRVEGSAKETQTLVFAGTERRTPTKWYSPIKSPRKIQEGGEGRHKHSSTSKRIQQQDTARSPKPQRNSSSDTTQQKQEDRTTRLQDEFTEGVLVECDSAFRSPSKGSVHSFRSPTRVTPKSRTPSKRVRSVNKMPEGSPVFRKASCHKRHPQTTVDAKRNISEGLNAEQTKVEVTGPQNSTPDKRGTQERQKLCPSSGRLKENTASLSPQPSPHNISDDITSPSLLQPLGSSSNTKMEPPLRPSLANQKKAPRGGGLGLPRPASSMSASTSSRRLSLRRHHRTEEWQPDRTSGTGMAKLHVSPPDSNRKKMGYKQTTVDNFLSPQAASGTKARGSTARRVFLDDEEALRLAMEESLQLKALADMSRGLDQREEEEGHVTMETASQGTSASTHPHIPNKAQHPIKESPIKLPNLCPAHSSVWNPKPSHGVPIKLTAALEVLNHRSGVPIKLTIVCGVPK